jgi:hypothetical protein
MPEETGQLEEEDQGIADMGYDDGKNIAKENESEPLKDAIESDQAIDQT